MPDRTMMIDGVRVPRFFYGTAWKKDETTRLTALALGQGFRGIDTANQPKHYHEAGVGRGILDAVKSGLAAFGDLGEPIALCLVEGAFDVNVARDVVNKPLVGFIAVFAVFYVDAGEFVGCAYRIQLPTLIAAVPGNRHAGAGGKRSEQQLVRIRSRVCPACGKRFVGEPLVPAVGQRNGHAGCQFRGDLRHTRTPDVCVA